MHILNLATLGGFQGLGAQYGNWKSLNAGFTIWLSQTEATGREPNSGRISKGVGAASSWFSLFIGSLYFNIQLEISNRWILKQHTVVYCFGSLLFVNY